ncbi:hypothetical protein QBC35DRAFT_376207 [Podospora australis]|uniref:NADAR domain-containing protein n=1 Tax=Podospora australis TaxID=1536484 RepID=A0AAN6X0W9_9PEZI|nr:hypothetical protein QBC35DRAFT_376207 [Podospora australis]
MPSSKTTSAATPPFGSAPSSAPDNHDSQANLYFWKTIPADPGYLSQWYSMPFTSPDYPGIVFPTAEHYMMYGKAVLFAGPSDPIGAEILSNLNPKAVKGLGRKIPNFDEEVWNKHRERIVQDGNYFKFTSPVPNAEGWVIKGKTLPELLLATGDRLLVEASPFDKIWGVGMDEDNADRAARSKWGLNLLGKALMVVRERIRAEQSKQEEGQEEKSEEAAEKEQKGTG